MEGALRRASRPSSRWWLLRTRPVPGIPQPGRPANGQSDDAARVIAEARAAMGGEAKLAAIKTLRRHRPHAPGARRQPRADRVRDPGGAARQVRAARRVPRAGRRPDGDRLQRRPLRADSGSRSRHRRVPAVRRRRRRSSSRRPARVQLANAKQDFARLMLGLFAASYPSHPLTFAYVGQAEAPQGRADVIDVKGPGRLRGAALRGRQDAPAGHAQLAGAAAAGARPRSRGRGPAVRRPAGAPPPGGAPAGGLPPRAAPRRPLRRAGSAAGGGEQALFR